MPELSMFALMVIITGLFLGGVLKGAAGAGLPVIALPVIASVTDIRFAVVLLAAPHLFTNGWQIVQYRQSAPDNNLCFHYAGAGAIGAVIGTLFLAYLPLTLLSIVAVSVVFLYLLLRVFKPDFQLSLKKAQKWVVPIGLLGGSLQGAIGLSSPVSITFLHAMQLGRETFIFTISVFFAVMSVLQVPTQIYLGISNVNIVAISTLTLLPILSGLYIGNRVARQLSPAMFDNIIIILLVAVSIKILVGIFISA